MKALPDKTESSDDVDNSTVDANVIDERGTAVLEYENVIEILSSDSETEEKAQVCGEEEEEEEEVEEEEEEGKQGEQEKEEQELEEGEKEEAVSSKPRKSKKKHKKHHHHHHHHHHHENDDTRTRKKHKKRSKQESGPIFLWAKKEESQILKVYCEDYDAGIKLVKTNGVWTSSPRSRVLAAVQARSSNGGHINVSETPIDSNESIMQIPQPDDRIKESSKNCEPILVDLNDNSIDFVDTISSEEEDDEEQTRARIDRALEMIDQDPALMSDVKIPLPTVETTSAIKLPEGTTIHQIKAENVAACETVSVATPSPPPLLLSETPMMQCKLGELTITTQQQQQNEPLNLETVSKRSALEIRLQEPPLKKKRVDKSPPAQPPLAVGQVKREWDPLSELKEVLSDPGLSVPDPLLVPRARLAALVSSPATEIPKLLREPLVLPPPPPDPDLLAVSLSHLRSMLQQHPGYADDRKSDSNQSSNIDQILWLSYLSKDMTGVDADLISTMLSILLPNSTTAQQSFSYPQDKNQWNNLYYDGNIETPYGSTPGFSKSDDCCAPVSPLPPPLPLPQILPAPQQPHPLLLPPPPLPPSQIIPATAAQPPILPLQQSLKHQQSQLLPPPQPRVQQQQIPRLLPKRSQQHNMTSQLQRLPSHPQQMPPPQMLPSRSQQLMPPLIQPPVLHRQPKRRVCQELCCNGSPSSCYGGSYCPKPSGYNPFTTVSPNGCNPFAISTSDCNPFTATPTASCGGGNPKTCATYAAPGAMSTCCFSSEISCGYNGRTSSPMPPRNPSVSPRNRAQYNYHNGPGQQQQMPMPEVRSVVNGCCISVTGCSSGVTGYSNDVSGCNSSVTGINSSSGVNENSNGVNGNSSTVVGCNSGVNDNNSGVDGSSSGVNGNSVSDIGADAHSSVANSKPKTPLPVKPANGDAGQPAYRPKIKVKEHLIDPNAKPRLLNIEGALHLAAGGHDLFSSSLWHPLFGSQAKPYGCRWQWTTPVTTSASTSSDNTSADTKH
ncbi:bromodomain-containing protein 4-like [Melanaphis sacchari]|uniref:bromodomain-containing protein 4-like n=1 Tax=Melanaphis sacchari TaxID=742174 RepID=UPI000DC13A2C|nr:bromodomain-containing protein 4-like [Melanaphis sacchari]